MIKVANASLLIGKKVEEGYEVKITRPMGNGNTKTEDKIMNMPEIFDLIAKTVGAIYLSGEMEITFIWRREVREDD